MTNPDRYATPAQIRRDVVSDGPVPEKNAQCRLRHRSVRRHRRISLGWAVPLGLLITMLPLAQWTPATVAAGMASQPQHRMASSTLSLLPRLRSDRQAQDEWFYGQRAAPSSTLPAGAWVHAQQQRALMRSFVAPSLAATPTWTALGPAPTTFPGYYGDVVSGRVTALVYDSLNNIIYAGAADGGLWKSADGGSTWTPLTDNQPSLAVGAIALDPNSPQTMYVGTGEDNFNGDAYYSAGILKSTDGGATWTVLAQNIFAVNNTHCSTGVGCSGAYISKIAVDPRNSSRVVVASSIGVYYSTNGGSTWTKSSLDCDGTYNYVSDMIIDSSTNPSRVYAACGNPSTTTGNGFYISTTGGASFSRSTGSPTGLGRVAIAQAPSTPNVLYLVASAPSTYASLGMWESTNSGTTWTQVAQSCASGGPNLLGANPFNCAGEQQGFYDIYVAVDPGQANTVYVGGVDIWKTTDAGTTWTDTTDSYYQDSIHPDQHAMAFTPAGIIYVGNDGGVYSTADGGNTWSTRNGNLAITQFYAGSTTQDFTSTAVIYGGAQDNGAQKYTGNPVWSEVYGGDGGDTATDPTNPNVAYEEYVYLQINKTTDGGTTWSPATSGINVNGTDKVLFIAPFVMDPTNPNRLLAGTNYLYETTNGAASWTKISPSLAANSANFFGAISAIAIAPSAPDTIYVGSGDGRVWRTTNDGGTWTNITTGTSGASGRYVTSIAVNPANAQDVDVAFSGFASTTGATTGTHLYHSTNAGASWTDVSKGLPDTPVNAVVRDPTNAQALYVGTDVGFFFTMNDGAGWTQYQAGLPNTSIDQLFTDANFTTFIVATHGRGMFTLPTSALSGTTGSSESWSKQTSGTTSILYALSCASTLACTAVGYGGTILSTTNGGTTWSKQTSGTTYTLYGVSCANPSVCTAVGYYGTILVTTNGGATWSKQVSGTTYTLYGVRCISTLICTAVGYDGLILATTNGGMTWAKQISGTTYELRAITCLSASVCTIVGYNGLILATTNGGATWSKQVSGTTTILYGVSCVSSQICTVVGYEGLILATTDGGVTWTKQEQVTSTANTLYAVSCADSATCTAVGYAGLILATTDGGVTWTKQTSGTTYTLYGTSCADTKICTAVGYEGTILRTD